MNERMTTAEFRRRYAVAAEKQPKGKYKSIAVTINGKRFDSKLEGNYYLELLRLMKLGDVVYFHRQVPIDLSMKSKDVYRLDFMVFKSDGTIQYIDTKGKETKVFKLKKSLIESQYPFNIQIVKSKEVPNHLSSLLPNESGDYIHSW